MNTSKKYLDNSDECFSRRSGKEIIGLDREHYKKFFQFYYSEDVSTYGCLYCFIEAYERGFWKEDYLEYTWALIPNCCTKSRVFNFPQKCWKCGSYLPQEGCAATKLYGLKNAAKRPPWVVR